MKDKNKALILIAIIVGTIFYFIANFQRVAIPGAVFDILEQELSVSAPYITAFGAIFMYVYALGQLITGVMVDRYGGFRVITCGGIILAIGCILFPLTSNLALMYLARGLIGLGCSMFYLSLVKELKSIFSDKNYGIALSVVLFIGYSGGIVANAPFVFVMHYLDWKEILLVISGIIVVSLLVFTLILRKLSLRPINHEVKLKVSAFKEVLMNPHNRRLFSFACCNYGIYYVIQTVIGKKFLEDFCKMPISESAFILSIMAIIAAVFNIINATVCKLCHNHRVIFLKSASLITFLSLLLICIFLYFDIRTSVIGLILCIISGNASLSALIIPVIQKSNDEKIAVTAVSVMNFSFFMMVGILGSLTGFLLHLFTPERINGVLVYGKDAYLTLFGVFLVLSVYEIYRAMKMSNEY